MGCVVPMLLATSIGMPASSAMAQGAPVAQAFEGAITIRLSAQTPQGVRTEQAEYLVRDGSVRVNVGGARGMAVLAAAGEQKLHLLMPAQRSYAELPMTASALLEAAGAPPADAQITRTGRTETVAGLSCEHVMVSRGTSSTDVCLTRELGRYVNPLDAMSGGNLPVWQQALAAEGFPLKVTMSDGGVPFQVLTVERRVLPRDLFAVPLDYTRTQPPRRR